MTPACAKPCRPWPAERRRFGYRRIHVMLRRQGIVDEPEEAAPALPRREAAGAPARRPQASAWHPASHPRPDRANVRWSLDFVSDAFTDGRRFRVLAVVDDYTRECLALVADTSLSGLRVTRELDASARYRGRPATIVSDNGTELTSMADPATGASRAASNGTTSRPASLCRTASSKASTAASATNA